MSDGVRAVIELVFAYLAGMLTLINPCILPVLPIVLGSALQADRFGPLALAAGMGISFVTLGVGVASIGPSIGVDTTLIGQIGAVMMMAFGAVLLVPALSQRFELATAGIASGADQRMMSMDLGSLRGQFLGGLLLGAVWSPCVGPTLGGAISLASRGENVLWAATIMAVFSLGVGTLIVGLALGAKSALRQRAQALRGIAERSKPLMGAVFLSVGLMLFFGVHLWLEAWLVRTLPFWLQDLSVAL